MVAGKKKDEDQKKGLPSFINRNALRDYNVLDRFEAGIALAGQEVKSIRGGGLNLRDSYGKFVNGEVILFELHIAPYKYATIDQLPPARPRRLLLSKSEIRKIKKAIDEKGMTLIPLKVYFKKHLIKVELGICKGRREYEKRAQIAEKDSQREKDQAIRERDHGNF